MSFFSQPVDGIRSAFLSEESLDLLNQLYSFRHMFRHAYGTDIQLRQLKPNVDIALQAYKLIFQDISQFLEQLIELTD
ncbi:MAG: hypothetical protein AAF572_03955 [Cyanobacteria bacterium P01_B01_bin.77]